MAEMVPTLITTTRTSSPGYIAVVVVKYAVIVVGRKNVLRMATVVPKTISATNTSASGALSFLGGIASNRIIATHPECRCKGRGTAPAARRCPVERQGLR